MGHTGFNAATYYRFAALNLDLLQKHLTSLDRIEMRNVVDAFIRSTIEAVPTARKTGMNANVRPAFVLGIVKDQGQPLQLINAFETPIASRNGITVKSIEALKAHHEQLKKTWNIAIQAEVAIPDVDLNTFCSRILNAIFPA